AGAALVRAVTGLGPFDRVLVLLSGGSSACACVPASQLEDLRAVAQTLLGHGLPIGVVNAARGRLDRLKHGGLARMAAPAQVHTLAAIDVLGPDPIAREAVGSAPPLDVSVDPALLGQALAVLPPSLAAALSAPAAVWAEPTGARR